ncbi:hypothetical protein HH219_13325 [Pseudoalteromonas sp. NEC-BIFX-2020_015]|uniref:hypothetical protein n=1 Tax=Pseudoalteromonas sp. NEC-BIFX-2020_015 TaxID=2729544 RepID=UPI0014614468|nr:hypothetical protein [Pseudoalteromonas sp. NEC-BIFX-2020_015]NMR26501.1 hypothetical protein [Pseudoalteromonas sp. NEC-BIFX-2020_015]
MANTQIELQEVIEELKVEVLPRGKGRTSEQCEQWVFRESLNLFFCSNEVELPFKVTKREKPDFHVEMAGTNYGVELTEIIHSDHAKALTLHQANVVDPSLFKLKQPHRTKQELKEVASRNKLTGTPWMGDSSVEHEFAQSVYDTTLKKHKKLKSHYTQYPVNCLLAYHNHSSPCLNYEKALKFTEEKLSLYWGNGFDFVLVLKHGSLFVFSKRKVFILKPNEFDEVINTN